MDHLAQLDKPSRIRAEFFLDEDDNREYCKISIIGDPSNLLRKVTPEIIAKFPKEYDLYRKQSGRPVDEVIGGTPLREIPGLDRDAAAVLRYNAIRNVEELAGIDEQTARGLGPGYLNFWRSAKLILQAKEAEQLRALLAEKRKDDAEHLREMSSNLPPASEAEPEKPKRGPGRPRKEEKTSDAVEAAQDLG